MSLATIALDRPRPDPPIGALYPTEAKQSSIGILTFHRCINYGSYWQARCLADGLAQKTGARVRVLDHASRRIDMKEWRCALRPEMDAPPDVKGHAGKVRAFADAQRALPLSERFDLHRPETAERFDTVIVGSDEVWNFRHPWYGSNTPFFGESVEADRLVAYAASFGNHDAVDGIDPVYRDHLQRFSAISVRDENSARLVRTAVGSQPPIVLDPCLLFPGPIKACAAEEESCLVLYGHDFPQWLAEAVREFAGARGLRIVSLGYCNRWADEQRLSVGPEDFVRIMANAAGVVTNFFHGCVFALIFGRPFATAPSNYRWNKIRDVTGLVGAHDRIVGPAAGAADYARLLSEPASERVNARIASLRRVSADYLRKALAPR